MIDYVIYGKIIIGTYHLANKRAQRYSPPMNECEQEFPLKIAKEGETILSNCDRGPAYEGAKPSYIIENLEDKEFLTKIVALTCEDLPLPKPKKKKEKK